MIHAELVIRLRPALLADLDALVAIEHRAFSDPWQREAFEAMLRTWGSFVLVAERQEREAVVGFVVGRHVLGEGEILDLAVAAEWRGQGIGRRLVDGALEAFEARGVRTTFLEVRESNVAAQALYARFGFERIDVRRRYYREPVEDAWVLRRSAADSRAIDR